MEISPFDVVQGDSLSTSAGGMAAQRVRMNVLANNLANLQTTRDAKGNFAPYIGKETILQSVKIDKNRPDEQGVAVFGILPSQTPFELVYDPSHPEADSSGYRKVPAVKLAREMVDMIEASRAYDANLTALNLSRSVLIKTTDILD